MAAGSAAEAFRILRAVWPRDVLELSPFALQYAAAWSKVDGGWGHWKAPEMADSHNWGAVHCSHGPPCDGSDCIEHVDHYADQREYRTCFKRYASDEDGARDFLDQLIRRRPETRAALAAGASVRDVAAAMRREHYFGGFCPKASAAGAGQDDPECEREAIDLAVWRLLQEAAANARATGEPDALAGKGGAAPTSPPEPDPPRPSPSRNGGGLLLLAVVAGAALLAKVARA